MKAVNLMGDEESDLPHRKQVCAIDQTTCLTLRVHIYLYNNTVIIVVCLHRRLVCRIRVWQII